MLYIFLFLDDKKLNDKNSRKRQYNNSTSYIHNNRFDINIVVTILCVLATGQIGNLDIFISFFIKKIYDKSKNAFSGFSLQIYLRSYGRKEMK